MPVVGRVPGRAGGLACGFGPRKADVGQALRAKPPERAALAPQLGHVGKPAEEAEGEAAGRVMCGARPMVAMFHDRSILLHDAGATCYEEA